MGTKLLSAIPPLDEIALGMHEGFEAVHKFGRDPASSTTEFRSIWDGSARYPYQYTNLAMTLKASAIGLEGVEVIVTWVDEKWDMHTKTVKLDAANSTTPVAVSDNMMFPFRMRIKTDLVTSTDILLENGGTLYAKISNLGNEYNQTQMAVMPIPKGYVGLVYHIGRSSTINKTFEVQFRAKPFEESMQCKRIVDLIENAVPETLKPPVFFPEKTIMEVAAKSDVSGVVSAWWDMILIDMNKLNIKLKKV